MVNEPSCLIMPHDNVSVTVPAFLSSPNYSSLQAMRISLHGLYSVSSQTDELKHGT